MPKRIKKHVAIIGAGTAGLTAQYYAEKAGASTLMMDPGPLGTTCARVGCMPSKLLIAAAEAAHSASGAGLFGVKASVRVDSAAVMRRVRKMRDMFVGGMLEEYAELEKRGILVKERAVFTGPNSLQAGDIEVEFRSAVIATGSVTVVPKPYQAHPKFIMTREDIFEQRRLPGSILVVGGGLIGLELGQALHRLGVRVTVLGLDRLVGPLGEPEMREEAIRLFRSELDFVPHHELLALKPSGKMIKAEFRADGKVRSGSYEKILIAAGQRPDFDGLELRKAGIPLDGRGMPGFDLLTMRAGRSNIFIAGDADTFRPALHEAAFEGRAAGLNAARYPKVEKYPRLCQMGVAFTDPQLAVVGRPLKELKGACCGSFNYKYQGRAMVMNAAAGRIRLYADRKTARLTGAEIIGPRAEHTAHLLAWAIENRMTVPRMLEMPFYHPVLEEGLQGALKDLRSRLSGKKPCACGETTLPGA